ncbi:hypothetical protein P3L10_019760 [Capsicum annuum]
MDGVWISFILTFVINVRLRILLIVGIICMHGSSSGNAILVICKLRSNLDRIILRMVSCLHQNSNALNNSSSTWRRAMQSNSS